MIGLHEAKDQGKNEFLHPGIDIGMDELYQGGDSSLLSKAAGLDTDRGRTIFPDIVSRNYRKMILSLRSVIPAPFTS